MLKFRIQGTQPEGVVTLEQAGDDVVIRVNGYGVGVLQSQGANGSELSVSEQVLQDLGITLRVDSGE